METLLQDIRYGLRMLRKSPGFTLVAVITLALGIGANTTIFSTVNAMLLRPFPFPQLDGIVDVWETLPKQDEQYLRPSPANFADWSEQTKSFDALAAGQGWDVNLNGEGISERVEAYRVTADFFPAFGMTPLVGRAIGTSDFQHGIAPVVVFSHGFWQRRLGADSGIVGRNLLLNGQKFTVVGVMGAEFDFPTGVDAWTPLQLGAAQKLDRGDHSLHVIGRLKTGVSLGLARADMQAIAARLAQQYPNTNAGHSVRVTGMVEDLTTGSRQFVSVLMGAAFFVLLLACANVANLQLARGTARRKEIALRSALGAGRWHIVRQLLVESVLVASMGGVAGLLVARWGLELSRRSIPPFVMQHVAGLKHLEVDPRVLAFTLALALLTGIMAGFAPALHISRPEVNEVLKESVRGGSYGPGRHRLRALLVVSEIALALVLLVGAGLMVKGFGNLANNEMGFDRSRVLSFHVALPESKYSDKDRIRTYYEVLAGKLQALPEVESAACVTSLPSGWSWTWEDYSAEGQTPPAPGEMRRAVFQSVTPGFFTTLRVPLRLGRLVSKQDGPDTLPVVVISEIMARRLWPGQDPLGKRLKLGRESELWRTIVGVVGDVKESAFDREASPTTYVPFAQAPRGSSALVVRTSGDPLALAASASAQVKSIDPDQPAYDVRTLEQLMTDDVSGVQFSARTMMVFGVVALLLAAAGIFAVMAYSVGQRTHEIGVRMALGARQGDVLRLVVGYATKMAFAGLVIGLGCAWVLTRAMSSILFGVVRMDATTFVLFTALLGLIALVAAYIPARWAAKIDPMVALRYE
jgi:putative ABC transport system permease protein